MGANNISRFKKLIDKLVEIQSTPKGIRCGVSSAIPATMLGCGSRIRGMDCRYWPGAPALPAKYSEQLDLVDWKIRRFPSFRGQWRRVGASYSCFTSHQQQGGVQAHHRHTHTQANTDGRRYFADTLINTVLSSPILFRRPSAQKNVPSELPWVSGPPNLSSYWLARQITHTREHNHTGNNSNDLLQK